jgi:phosphate transport system substrate-binding protein
MSLKHQKKKMRFVSLFIAAIFPLSTYAQQGEAPQANQDNMVEWLTPPAKSVQPQTPAQEEKGRQMGRPEPPPESLQPTLDPGLPAYQPRNDIQISGTFKAAASDVLARLAKMWIEGFKKYYPGVNITVPPPYAGSLGARELIKGDIDFVFVSRELKPDDITDFQAKFGYKPLSVPICGGSYRHFGFLDAVGFFVNKQNPLEKISFEQLDAVLSRTRYRGGDPVTRWGQLGLTGEWADKPVHIYGIKPWNGFEEFVRQRVLNFNGQRGEWREDINFEKLVFPIAKRVAADTYGIGYSGLAYIDAPVKMLPLSESKGGPYYAPTYENVAQATYPLSRLVYFNVNRSPGKELNPAVEEFVKFILSREGQQIVLNQAIFLPLRESQAESSRAMLH